MAKVKLSEVQRSTLLEAQRLIHDVLPQLDRLEQCGEDCALIRSRANDVHNKITALMQHFGEHSQHTS